MSFIMVAYRAIHKRLLTVVWTSYQRLPHCENVSLFPTAVNCLEILGKGQALLSPSPICQICLPTYFSWQINSNNFKNTIL